ncbi:MAG: TY-Chap domain-containing protein [Steroidobacteraceae bacterium]
MVAALVAVPSEGGAQSPTSLRELLVQYRCPVVDRLDRIYEAGDPASPRDRFLALTVEGHRHGYVQCMFVAGGTKLLCEAASGFYYDKPGTPRTFHQPADAVAALGRLGFDTDDSAGNFRIELDVAAPPDFNAIADFMLRTLHDGYGARADSNLKFNAPFARRPTSKCIPVS